MKKFFDREDYKDGFYKTSKQIHQGAFNELSKNVSENNIPIIIATNYKYGGFAIFEFKSKKEDVYFYEFISTDS